MRLTYDPRYNVAYLRFREATTEVETISVSDELNVDLAPDGTVYGVELLNANAQLRSGDGGALVWPLAPGTRPASTPSRQRRAVAEAGECVALRRSGVVEDTLEERAAFERRVGELGRRRPGFPDQNRPIYSLLQAIVWVYKVRDDMVLIEANAKARRAMADVKREERDVAEDELERVDTAFNAVEEGLRTARASAGREVSFDSRDPEQDRLAGALIANLVATDFATVRTEELGDEQYRYHVAVDWPRLDALAARIDLPPVERMLEGRS